VNEFVDPAEYAIDFNVPVSALPPPFDNTRVVSVDDNMSISVKERREGVCE
jgi:hypothetical protein